MTPNINKNGNGNGKSDIDLNIMGKIPPQAVELEVVILGALILESFVLPEMALLLSPELFYKPAHQKIYRAILQLFNDNKPVDLRTVTEKLKSNGHLDEVGGPYYLTILTDHVASSGNIEAHIRIITEKFIAREQIRISHEVSRLAFNETTDVFDTHDKLENELSRINNYIIGKDYEGDNGVEIERTFKIVTEPRINRLTGISTGRIELDEQTGGWGQGNMIIIAGRPSHGKTTRALQFAIHALIEGAKVAFFSAEMNKTEINKKLLTNISGVPADILKKQTWTPDQLELLTDAKNRIKNFNFYLNDKCGIKPNYIKTICTERKRRYGLDLIIIDYLQLLMANETHKGQSEEQRVASISLAIKTLAKNLNVPIIILSQLSRECETRNNKRPIPADLRYSGSLEQDSDLILSVYRPSIYYQPGADPDYKNKITNEEEHKKLSELGIIKNRNGESGNYLVEYLEGAKSKYFKWFNELKSENEKINVEEKLPF